MFMDESNATHLVSTRSIRVLLSTLGGHGSFEFLLQRLVVALKTREKGKERYVKDHF